MLGASPEQLVDHINGDGLDNRRVNIRLCTKADNQRNQRRNSKNTTGYKGVSFDKARGKYSASIGVHGEQISLGRFSTAEEASQAYEDAVRRYHGEFAYSQSAGSVPLATVQATAERPQYSSTHRGVVWNKRLGKWISNIVVNGRSIHLGTFSDETAAARAYNEAAVKYHGDKAVLNQI